MRNLVFTVTVLFASMFFISCEKDEILAPEYSPANESYSNNETIPPYEIPEINTEADYSGTVYIDPSASSNGNGSMSSPLRNLPSSLQPNTAYLIKRGTTHPSIQERFDNVLIGAYGTGESPIIEGGIVVENNSRNTTLRDLDITNTANTFVLDFLHQNTSTDITVAFNKIRGIQTGGKYPKYALHHTVTNLVLFNNEIFNIENNGWWLSSRKNNKVIRNWFHNVNKGGETSTDNTGDGIQAQYGLDGLYFAGNIIDKTNSMWKYALMLNGDQKNNVFEYNTFYAPKGGAGGAGVRWMAHENGIFRKNLVRSVCDHGTDLVVPFDTWDSHANKTAPYGIRDNHILRKGGTIATVSTNGVTLDGSNKVFSSNEEYSDYLQANAHEGLYGSDITSANFWDNSKEAPAPIDADRDTTIPALVMTSQPRSE